jgi:hypothetical protein
MIPKGALLLPTPQKIPLLLTPPMYSWSQWKIAKAFQIHVWSKRRIHLKPLSYLSTWYQDCARPTSRSTCFPSLQICVELLIWPKYHWDSSIWRYSSFRPGVYFECFRDQEGIGRKEKANDELIYIYIWYLIFYRTRKTGG